MSSSSASADRGLAATPEDPVASGSPGVGVAAKQRILNVALSTIVKVQD